MKEILIAGATGKLGMLISKHLLTRGSQVRLLARDPEKAQSLLGTNAIIFKGDVCQPATLTIPMKGVTHIICTIGGSSPLGANSPQHVDYEGVANLVESAITERVGHFVLVSSCAVTKPNHSLNAFGNVLSWKLRGENILRESGLVYTIIRPGGLTDEAGGQHLLQLGLGDRTSGMISRADVARTCIEVLEYPSTKNATFEIIQNAQTGTVNWAELFAYITPDANRTAE